MSLTHENLPLASKASHATPDNMPTLKEMDESGGSPVSQLIQATVRMLEEDNGYEELPTENSLTHIAAGCTAGIAEHCTMYPVDLIKTRMMAVAGPAAGHRYSSMLQSLQSIVATEGITNLWRGMPVVLLWAGPAHGAYFAAYEALKRQTGSWLGNTNPLGHCMAGAGASLVHDAVMTPVDAVKQRMQKHQSCYKSSMSCCSAMMRQEGFTSFYRSYGTQICMNVPQQCIHFMVYEWCKRKLNPNNEYKPTVHIVSGGAAGALAAVITTPLDVCKTLLNTQPTVAEGSKAPAIRGLKNGIRTIYSVSGVSGFYKGWAPRMLTIAPSTAICWWIYEMFKFTLS